ncbi:MAG: hypothetical protein BWZ05_01883 [Bacteroidetes bacterium ADurb.BinA245]|nr:MAG: hypothetical protein BWZ05_01883 [Bacteroidetes bacterium ADurb.BinA245]
MPVLSESLNEVAAINCCTAFFNSSPFVKLPFTASCAAGNTSDEAEAVVLHFSGKPSKVTDAVINSPAASVVLT